MALIDISRRIEPGMFIYPGDPDFHSHPVCSFAQGDACEVSALQFGSHCGTHIDAPSHMINGGASIGHIPLDRFYGPCRVVTLSEHVICERTLKAYDISPGERILLRTLKSGEKTGMDRASLSLSAARYLANLPVSLIGIDTPTVEDMKKTDGEVHRALLHAGVAILEGLDLTHTADGSYTLIALPLRLEAENGSPCRAVLVKA